MPKYTALAVSECHYYINSNMNSDHFMTNNLINHEELPKNRAYMQTLEMKYTCKITG